ncbi:MAG TPA: tetratricopeptide repeat protein, partial [Solirubrobacteraceae bacterium]|nr:tetratricopeptide repeat protein [Solirubrobacteraceae bacterium]
ALAAVAAIALAVALFALLGGDDGADERRGERPSTTRQQDRPREQQPTQTAPATPPPAADEDDEEQPPDDEPEEGPGPAAGAESPEELDSRGYALLQAGDAEAAVPVLEEAVRGFEAQGDAANPTRFGYALYNLGEAYAAIGRYDEAVAMYERRLQVSPNDRPELVRKRIERAKKRAEKG